MTEEKNKKNESSLDEGNDMSIPKQGISETKTSGEMHQMFNGISGGVSRLRFTIGKKLALGFGLAFVILFIISIVSYNVTTKLIDSNSWTKHTYEALLDLEVLCTNLINAETGQRGYIITGQERYLMPYQAADKEIEKGLGDIRELTSDNPAQQRRLDAIEPLVAAKMDELAETIDLRKTQGLEAATQMVLSDKGKSLMDDIRKIMDEMIDEELMLLETRSKKEQTTVAAAKATIIFGTLTALVFLSFVTIFITRGITNRVRQLVNVTGNVAKGDLTAEISAKSNDEISVLAGSVNQMVGTLRELIDRVRNAGFQIVSSSAQILSASQQHATAATEQSSQVTEVSTAIEELSATAEQVAQLAEEVSNASDGTVQSAEAGKQSVMDTVTAMGGIKQSVTDMSETIKILGKKTGKVTGILDLLDDITEQTNLLALNAAIEASKAGEAGKGFTVVADEIRKLADGSRKATKDIGELIEEIQSDTQETVSAMDKNMRLVEEGGLLATKAGDAIKEITGSIEESAKSAKQILLAAQQQTSGSSQISKTMNETDILIKQTAAGTEQSIRSAKELAAMAEQLKASISQFKVTEA